MVSIAMLPLRAQTQAAGPSGTGSAVQGQSSGSESENENRGGAASYTPSANFTSNQNPFLSSVPEAKPEPGVLQLSFKDAMQRALRNNLGLLLASDSSLAARGQKWQELSHLLPNVSAAATQSAAQIDLAALGFRFNFPGISPVVGPIGTFDARGYVTAPLFD